MVLELGEHPLALNDEPERLPNQTLSFGVARCSVVSHGHSDVTAQ